MSDSVRHIDGRAPQAEAVTRHYAKGKGPGVAGANIHKPSLNVSDDVNFAGAEKLAQLVQQTVELEETIDSDAVRRAKELFEDPSYPPKKLIQDLSRGVLSPISKLLEREQEVFDRKQTNTTH